MKRFLNIPLYNWVSLGLMGLCLLASWQNLIDYIRPDLSLALCLLIAPFTFQIKEEKTSWRLIWVVFASLILFQVLHMQIWFLIAVGASLFLIIESRHGKLGVLPWMVLLLLSPMLNYLQEVFTFPIRLEMSEWAANVLQAIGQEVSVSGNVFKIGGHSFSVDQACMGLHSIITGLIITILLLAQAQKQSQRKLPFWTETVLIFIAGLLLLAGNFFRIVMLVMFRSAPETLSHELIGLMALGIYLVLPIYLLIKGAISRFGRLEDEGECEKPSRKKIALFYKREFLFLLPFVFLFWFNMNRGDYRTGAIDLALQRTELNGLEKEILPTGIAKFTGDDLLVYIKPAANFWRADHVPTVCWQASGYQFTQIRTETICGHTLFVAELVKEEDKLYTVWWYDNGTTQTNDQWDWRWRNFKGEKPFRLYNVSGSKIDFLRKECCKILSAE